MIVRSLKRGVSCTSFSLKACLNFRVKECSAAVCRKHLKFFRDEEDDKQHVHPSTTKLDCDVFSDTSDDTQSSGPFEDINDVHALTNTGFTMVDSSDDESPQLESNSGVVPQFADVTHDSNNATPCHWLQSSSTLHGKFNCDNAR